MAIAKQKKNRKAQKKKRRATGSRPTRGKTIDLTLTIKNVNVELVAGGGGPRRERVKRITSRKRMNLREMRQSMPGAGGPQAFANPAFYGNVKMLTDSAMNQFQNQRYSMERELREMKAEGRAVAEVGKRVEGHDEQITQMQRRYDELVEAHGRLAEGARGGRGVVGASVFASPSGSFAESPRGEGGYRSTG